MKCQRCSKPATYHITDIDHAPKGRKIHEYHLCDEHASQHLAGADDPEDSFPIGKLAKELSAGPSGKAAEADRPGCPNCGISFAEFKNSGRLGCPNDYEVFRDDLMPLLENIHDATQHSGKSPRRAPRGVQQLTQLIQLRNELKKAVAAEDYEAAARLRDQIKAAEAELGTRRQS